jgi:hypothetical protein
MRRSALSAGGTPDSESDPALTAIRNRPGSRASGGFSAAVGRRTCPPGRSSHGPPGGVPRDAPIGNVGAGPQSRTGARTIHPSPA